MNTRALYVGTFDPVHYGHLDLIKRSLSIFKEVIVGIGINTSKNTLFSLEERICLIKQSIKEELLPLADYIDVVSYENLSVDLAKQYGGVSFIRGIRTLKDYTYEADVATLNKKLAPELETILLFANPEVSYVSSSVVKELASMKHDTDKFVPACVAQALKNKFHY